jgi:hypothetical protein
VFLVYLAGQAGKAGSNLCHGHGGVCHSLNNSLDGI